MSKDPVDLGVDLHIAQLLIELTVGTTWPRIHPHGSHPLTEQLNPAAKKGPRPSDLPVITVERPHARVATRRGPSRPLHTPSWVGGRGSYP
jgi:hypothetical protein